MQNMMYLLVKVMLNKQLGMLRLVLMLSIAFNMHLIESQMKVV